MRSPQTGQQHCRRSAALCRRSSVGAGISQQHTGAALSARNIGKRLPGIRRCALAGVHPTSAARRKRRSVFADLGCGGDARCDGRRLGELCHHGIGVCGADFKNPRPKLLLSNGAEAGKGPKEVVKPTPSSNHCTASTLSATSRASTSLAASLTLWSVPALSATSY